MLKATALLDIVVFPLSRHPAILAASVLLLCCSATFSGCETALFSLTVPELNRIRAGRGRIDRVVATLHADLNRLLATLLFCNMLVNVMLYALSAVVVSSLGAIHGAAAAFAYGMASLCVVIFFGEVLPKQAAIASRLWAAKLTVLPVWACHRALAGPMRLLHAVTRVCERVLDIRGGGTHPREEEFRLLMEFSRADGVISEDEYELLDGIVELPGIKIRDIMTPRVDLVMIKADTSREDALKLARICGHVKFPVFDAEKDDLAGWVDTRELVPHPARGNVAPLIRKLRFFSEHDRVDQALKRMGTLGDVLMAVVDERGQTVGIFTPQDVMDEILGRFGDYGNAPPENVRECDGGYILAGGVPVREWRDLFDIAADLPQGATVGGLVLTLLGRPAKAGDRIRLENIEMTVRSVWRNRVTEVAARRAGDAASGEEGEA